MSAPKVLVVGAGAVGQAYALALSRGGAEVSFFIKPHHEARLAPGMPIREVGLFSKGPLTDLSALPRIHDWSDVAATEWHSIWLAVDSTSLAGDWVHALGRARGSASIVLFQTGTSARDHLAVPIPPEVRVSGMIPFVAWWTPLEPHQSEAEGPHMCVWHPPLMRTPLSGPADRVAAVAALLRAGGAGARILDNAAVQGAMGSAVLLPTIAGLEVHGWHLNTLTRRTHLRPILAAIAEAQRITARIHGVSAPPARLLRPMLVALGARLAPLVAPLNLETYLRVHFTKVGAQTAAALSDLCAAADAQGTPAPALAELRHALQQTRGA